VGPVRSPAPPLPRLSAAEAGQFADDLNAAREELGRVEAGDP